MAGDEARVGQRGDDVALGGADVGDDRVGAGGGERVGGDRGDAADRRADDDEVGVPDRGGEVVGGRVERADREAGAHRVAVGVVADDLRAQPLAGGEAHGPADEPYSEDGQTHGGEPYATMADPAVSARPPMAAASRSRAT
ncbi:hypothetical protein GKE82_04140 [Conexibacter sp. W3-3-2]|nr:hypothetical protein [Conexibacter sp. W3-3-2]